MMIGAQSEGRRDSYECIINMPYDFLHKMEDYQNLLITLEKVRLDLV